MVVELPPVEEGGDEKVYLTYSFKVHSAGVGCHVDGTVIAQRILSPCGVVGNVIGVMSHTKCLFPCF